MNGSKSYEVVWRRKPPGSVPTEQVYGILFDPNGQVLILKDGEHYTLPGGRPEAGEGWHETLRRECLEEAQATIGPPLFLGHALVHEKAEGTSRSFAQVRMVADIVELLPAQPDPATGRIYLREFHTPAVAVERLAWGDHGRRQFADACRMWTARERVRRTGEDKTR